MDEAGDMFHISVPFVLGISAGALLGTSSVLSFNSIGLLSGISLTLCVASALLISRYGPMLPVSFFLAGIFCFTGWFYRGSLEISIPAAEHGLRKLQEIIGSIPYRHGSTPGVVSALLSGDKGGVPRSIVRSFRVAGAAHILALSGMHLGVIYLLVRKAFAFLGNSTWALKVRCLIVSLSCLWYALMTGMGPSITRALLFILITEAARIDPERKNSAARRFSSALVIQLALSPGSILTPGFQLSYLAMAGIIFVYPSVQSWFKGGPLTGRIWNSAALSISCQLFTAPLCWILWKTFPRYFLLTNLIAVPMSSAVMFTSLPVIMLTGLGVDCPEWMVCINEFCVRVLIRSLEVIASM